MPMDEGIELQVRNIVKEYSLTRGRTVVALQDVSFTARRGEFISIVGPSGCGKSTLVKLLAGLDEPTSGEVLGRIAAAGNRGVVFQQYSLFPWLTVEENIGFGLHLLGAAPQGRREVVARYIVSMHLEGFEKAYPKELSGGMQQRVALARTLATNPQLLLMDEPFGALDVQTRRSMRHLLLQLWESEPRTVIFVTHDIEEAILLSDTVYVMSPHPGRIRERIAVALPRPRDLNTEFSPSFLALKKHLQEIITDESPSAGGG